MSSVRASAVFVGVVVDFSSSIAGGMLWGIVQGIRGARQGAETVTTIADIERYIHRARELRGGDPCYPPPSRWNSAMIG